MVDCTQDPEVDAGHGVRFAIRRMDGKAMGLVYWHPCTWEPATKQGDFIPFNEPPSRTFWDVLKEDPITLSPSLLCPICKHHGFFEEGKWRPA